MSHPDPLHDPADFLGITDLKTGAVPDADWPTYTPPKHPYAEECPPLYVPALRPFEIHAAHPDRKPKAEECRHVTMTTYAPSGNTLVGTDADRQAMARGMAAWADLYASVYQLAREFPNPEKADPARLLEWYQENAHGIQLALMKADTGGTEGRS